MSGIATLAGASVDHMTGPIAIPLVAASGIILLIHSTFDVTSAEVAPDSASVQRGRTSATVNRPVTNYTHLTNSTSLITPIGHASRDLSAEALRPCTIAIDRAIANHQSGSNPIGDAANTLFRGCR